MTAALEILLIIAAIYVIARSPRKFQTFGRMVIAFLVILLLSIIGSVFLRVGDPEVWGVVGRLLALLAAVIVGWRQIRSLAPNRKPPEQG